MKQNISTFVNKIK